MVLTQLDLAPGSSKRTTNYSLGLPKIARWLAEYGIGAGEGVRQRQERNLAALVDGYGPSKRQRGVLAEAIAKQMVSHASDLEDMARTDPAFARLVDLDYARAAHRDAEWWVNSSLHASALGTL